MMREAAAPARPSLTELVDGILRVHPTSEGLQALTALRADGQFARQELANLISQDPQVLERIQTGYSGTPDLGRLRPFTPRDAIDVSGYRTIHCSSIGCTIADLVTELKPRRRVAGFWPAAFVGASFASVIAETVQAHQDEAFAGAFLRATARLLLNERAPVLAIDARDRARARGTTLAAAERELAGYSHLDLIVALAEAWELPASILPAFEEDGPRDSLPNIIRRAALAAAHHGFADPLDAPLPADEVALGDRIVFAYLRSVGGLDLWLGAMRAFAASARVEFDR